MTLETGEILEVAQIASIITEKIDIYKLCFICISKNKTYTNLIAQWALDCFLNKDSNNNWENDVIDFANNKIEELWQEVMQ